jgi:Flp pilus assembly protein TadG
MLASCFRSQHVTRPHRAQALVELAVVLPVMLIILLGMVDLGRAFVFGVAVQNGAREAARLGARAAIDSTIDNVAIRQRLITASAPALAGCSASTDTSQNCGIGTWTLAISVAATDGHTYPSVTAVPPAYLPGSRLTVTASGSSLSMFAGFATGLGMKLSAINAQGQAVMMVL